MTPLGGFALLILIGIFGYLIVKDKRFDGLMVFAVGNVILLIVGTLSLLYALLR